jgi:hypothetical protein
MRRLKEWISLGAWAESTIRKSLPQAVALTNGTLAISVALNGRIVTNGEGLAVNCACAGQRIRKGVPCKVNRSVGWRRLHDKL